MLQNATPLRKSAPWPPNISHEHVFCTAPGGKMHLCRSSSNVPRLPWFLETQQKPHVLLTFWQGAQSLAPATRNDIWTSKSGASMWCFVPFDFEMCFAPQRCALFRHLNFQKWSDPGVFCNYILTSKCASRHNGVHFFDIATSKKCSELEVFFAFSLTNVLRATAACTFSSLIWPDGSAPTALASLLFDPPEPQIIGKTQCFVTFLPFRASASSFFWLFLFLICSLLLFSSLCLCPALLFICPYCRKFDF